MELLVSADGPARVLTLNRPAVLNAINATLRRSLARAVAEAAASPAVRVVIVTGAGERAFSAGQDLTEVAALAPKDEDSWRAGWCQLFETLLACEKPIIAAVNGVAVGGGCAIAALADLRVAARTARFALSEVDVCMPSVLGGYLLMNQVFLSRAVELVETGREMSAEEARRVGFVHELAEAPELAARARGLADELAAKAPTALRLTLGRMREVVRTEFSEVLAALERYQRAAFESGVPQRTTAAFLARRGGAARARP